MEMMEGVKRELKGKEDELAKRKQFVSLFHTHTHFSFFLSFIIIFSVGVCVLQGNASGGSVPERHSREGGRS